MRRHRPGLRPVRRGVTGDGSAGIALVAALLTLASLLTLALATTLLLSFDLKLVENRQEAAIARASATSRLNVALLAIASQIAGGELPEAPPAAPGVLEYRRLDERTAVLLVEGSEGSGRYVTGARVELRPGPEGWKVHIAERR